MDSTQQVLATVGGVAYDPLADVWSLAAPGGPVRLDFRSLPVASAALRAEAKRAAAASVGRGPPRAAQQDLASVRRLLRRAAELRPGVEVGEITQELVRVHDAALPPGSRYLAGHLAAALRRWAAAGAGGLSPGLAGWLSCEPAEAHAAGRAVRTCCQLRGALPEQERDSLLAALHAARASGTVAADDYAMSLLVAVLGLRPIQVAWLKAGDLREPSDPAAFAADLLVPRAKQRDGARPREKLTARGLVAALADAVSAQRDAAAAWAVARGMVPEEAPLFPAMAGCGPAAPGFAGHMSASAVGIRVSATLDGLRALPAGTGHAFPLRLRRTFATGLARAGCGVAEISLLLDHTGRDGALAYIEASPTLGPRLGQATGAGFADLAARLRGPGRGSPP